MTDELLKIDAIRQRFEVSFEQAKAALDAAGGDVVQALIDLEKHDQSTWTEKVHLQGSELVSKIKDLIKEGNVRRIVVKQDDRTVFEIPLTLGAIGAAFAPQLAAIGAVAALLTRCTIEIERDTPPSPGNEVDTL